MSIDLSQYSESELESLINNAEELVAKKKKQKSAAVIQQIKELAASIDVSVEIIREPKKTKSTLPDKYRNPANPEETWKGRGPKPKWLRAALESGAQLSDFEIKS